MKKDVNPIEYHLSLQNVESMVHMKSATLMIIKNLFVRGAENFSSVQNTSNMMKKDINTIKYPSKCGKYGCYGESRVHGGYKECEVDDCVEFVCKRGIGSHLYSKHFQCNEEECKSRQGYNIKLKLNCG